MSYITQLHIKHLTFHPVTSTQQGSLNVHVSGAGDGIPQWG
jgi:hypothetical protein